MVDEKSPRDALRGNERSGIDAAGHLQQTRKAAPVGVGTSRRVSTSYHHREVSPVDIEYRGLGAVRRDFLNLSCNAIEQTGIFCP